MQRISRAPGAPALIQQHRFGNDHWFVLLQLWHLCQDAQSDTVDITLGALRCNEKRHPEHAGTERSAWKPAFGTRLAGYWGAVRRWPPDAAVRSGHHLIHHDDWDCLLDLEGAGFVRVLSWGERRVQLTPSGLAAGKQAVDHWMLFRDLSHFELKLAEEPRRA